MTEQVQWADYMEPAFPASGSPNLFDETVGDYAADQYSALTGHHRFLLSGRYVLPDVANNRSSEHRNVLEASNVTTGGELLDALTTVLDDPEDVFGSVDVQSDRHQQIETIVQHIRRALAFENRDRIANRIEVLEEARLEELDYGDLPLSSKSLEAFVSFLDREPDLKYPILTLNPDGHVFAEWEAAPNRYFAVEFLAANDDVRFVIFSPNPRHHDKRMRLSGSATVDTLMIVAEPHGVRSWAGMEDERSGS